MHELRHHFYRGQAAPPLSQLRQDLLRALLGQQRAAAQVRARQAGARLQQVLHVPADAFHHVSSPQSLLPGLFNCCYIVLKNK